MALREAVEKAKERFKRGEGAMGGLSWESEALGTVEVCDPAADKWATMPNMATPRMLFVATAAEGEVYAIGGAASDFTCLSSVEAFKP